LTGQLGDVMKESAQAALSLVKAQAADFGIDPKILDQSDIHVHVPAGAIPKDGPSAGVAMFVSLASLLRRRPVRPDVAMTGEISLRGLVRPVGGIKEKTIAAERARDARARVGGARVGGAGGGSRTCRREPEVRYAPGREGEGRSLGRLT